MTEAGDACSNTTVTLLVDNKRIVCCRGKLRAASGYFSAMFTNGMKESRSSEILLKDVDHSMVRTLVDYSEERGQFGLVFELATAVPLLQTANMLQFDQVVPELEQYLMNNISCKNCCDVMSVADVCGFSALYDKARGVACWYFDDVVNVDELGVLSYDMFVGYVTDDRLRSNSEINIFKGIELWIRYDDDNRRQHQRELLETVKWHHINESQLNEIAGSHGLSNEYLQACINRLGDNQLTRGRYPPDQLVVLGGEWLEDDRSANLGVLVYLKEEERVRKVTSLPQDYSAIWGFQACTLGKDLFLVGGEKKGEGMCRQLYSSLWHYDSVQRTWDVMTTLPTPRRHLGLVVSGPFLYLIGGFGRYRVIQNTVDRYNIENDNWEKQPNLNQAVFSVAACCCDDSIYVFGDLATEILKPNASSWQQRTGIVPSKTKVAWAVCHDTSIYMVADLICLSLYDTKTDQVSYLGTISGLVGRAVVISNTIYVVSPSGNIESYDIEENTFKVEHKMEKEISKGLVVALPKLGPCERK